MKIFIVAHHSRRERAEKLASSLDAEIIMDEGNCGALWGHTRALRLCEPLNERCIIMEDDALPVADFVDLAQRWMGECPDDLLSFYLGTGRPPQYQTQIAHLLRRADQWREEYITLPQLIHGVCYSVPQDKVKPLLSVLPLVGAADFAIGSAWRCITNKPIIYPVRSLVDHDDLPSVEVHPDGQKRTEPRRAWRLETANGR
ncbi:hypothetical protein N7376_22110 [Brucella intermedia GD04153]|uniref:Glycosyltransferase n=1 Tax=Brucella intermedia GD04153 TaxID=2975438 RepID=A0AA42H295_9HYPH|nr:hypothetical protein [Brucella intermedia]MDH0126674.1 hypothetical protein [Brucella intermedia GD04153]